MTLVVIHRDMETDAHKTERLIDKIDIRLRSFKHYKISEVSCISYLLWVRQ